MRRVLVSVVLVAAVVAAAAGSAASAPGSETVHALTWKGRTLSLAALDARTLAPRGRPLAIGRLQGSFYADELGERIAVASPGTGIVVVDTRRMRVLWRVPRGRLVRAVSWVSPSRLLVAEHGGALLLDPLRKRIVARTDYSENVVQAHAWSDGLVMLTQRGEYGIEAARLLVIGPGVRVRRVELARIASGFDGGDNNQGPFRTAQPGLAVDVAGGRAFVAGGLQVATVDLSTLSVGYGGTERTLQKAAAGPRRSAAWLGDGALAIAGSDESVRGNDHSTLSSTPFGLRYVTSAGVRIVDEQATAVRGAGGMAFAFGVRYTDGRAVGIGLAAYDRQGALRWRLFGDAPVTDVTVANGLGYVWAAGRWNVVDLAAGAIVGDAPLRGMLMLGTA